MTTDQEIQALREEIAKLRERVACLEGGRTYIPPYFVGTPRVGTPGPVEPMTAPNPWQPPYRITCGGERG